MSKWLAPTEYWMNLAGIFIIGFVGGCGATMGVMTAISFDKTTKYLFDLLF
jgi:hypothetical protein